MKKKHVSVVFVVDDEVVISKSLALILQRSGYTTRFFTDPLEALEHIRASPPDLLISDVAMPQLSGIDLAIQTQAHCPIAKSFSSLDRHPRLICSVRQESSGTISHYCPNRSIPKTSFKRSNDLRTTP